MDVKQEATEDLAPLEQDLIQSVPDCVPDVELEEHKSKLLSRLKNTNFELMRAQQEKDELSEKKNQIESDLANLDSKLAKSESLIYETRYRLRVLAGGDDAELEKCIISGGFDESKLRLYNGKYVSSSDDFLYAKQKYETLSSSRIGKKEELATVLGQIESTQKQIDFLLEKKKDTEHVLSRVAEER